jgi:hypothetical protein
MNLLLSRIRDISALFPEPPRHYAPVRFGFRVSAGLVVALLISLIAFYGLTTSNRGAADFGPAIFLAKSIVHGQNPYGGTYHFDSVGYPLTSVFFALPFFWLRPEAASAVFIGISSGLLAFAVTQKGWNRLLIFASYPFWAAVVSIQWSPLLMAGALLPWFYPVVIAKPNIGLPVAIQSINRRGVVVALLLTLVTFLIQPNWPVIWWRTTRGFQSFIPIAGIGVVSLVMLLWARRDADSRFFLLMAATPQRWYYDALLLWLIPASTPELLAAGIISWCAFLVTPQTRTIQQVALISTVFNYLPMLGILLIRKFHAFLIRSSA